MAVDESGKYIPFTKSDNKKDTKYLEHRQFSVTLRPVQLYDAIKTCIHNGEIDPDRLLTLIRIASDELNRKKPEYHIDIWTYIKSRTEKAIRDQKKKYNIK